jgi:transcriptional regulator with XRE-family HTH domain
VKPDLCQHVYTMEAGKIVISQVSYPPDMTFGPRKGVNMANIGDRILRLRQNKKWTQADLGEKIGVHQKQVSAYERNVNIPSTEILIKLAEAFDVTLDYLAFEAKGQPAKLNIQDRELLRRFETVDKLNEHEKSLAKEILDLIILKHKFQSLADPNSLM